MKNKIYTINLDVTMYDPGLWTNYQAKFLINRSDNFKTMRKKVTVIREFLVNFRQHPILSIIGFIMTVFILIIMVLAIILTISPQSKIGHMVEGLFRF